MTTTAKKSAMSKPANALQNPLRPSPNWPRSSAPVPCRGPRRPAGYGATSANTSARTRTTAAKSWPTPSYGRCSAAPTRPRCSSCQNPRPAPCRRLSARGWLAIPKLPPSRDRSAGSPLSVRRGAAAGWARGDQGNITRQWWLDQSPGDRICRLTRAAGLLDAGEAARIGINCSAAGCRVPGKNPFEADRRRGQALIAPDRRHLTGRVPKMFRSRYCPLRSAGSPG